MNHVEENAVNDEQDVYNNKQMVWIPEGIETCEPVKGLG